MRREKRTEWGKSLFIILWPLFFLSKQLQYKRYMRRWLASMQHAFDENLLPDQIRRCFFSTIIISFFFYFESRKFFVLFSNETLFTFNQFWLKAFNTWSNFVYLILVFQITSWMKITEASRLFFFLFIFIPFVTITHRF